MLTVWGVLRFISVEGGMLLRVEHLPDILHMARRVSGAGKDSNCHFYSIQEATAIIKLLSITYQY